MPVGVIIAIVSIVVVSGIATVARIYFMRRMRFNTVNAGYTPYINRNLSAFRDYEEEYENFRNRQMVIDD